MAGQWIKMRTDLHTDPAVMRLTATFKADSFRVVGWLHAVWVWADTHADCHGHVTLVSRSCLDIVTQCPGFGDALEAVGWLKSDPEETGGISFPRFDRHMGEGAKARAQAAKRKQTQRLRAGAPGASKAAGGANGHAPVTQMSRTQRDASVTRGEERREEKEEIKTDPPAPRVRSGSEPVRPSGPDAAPGTEPFDPLRHEQANRKQFEARWRGAGLRPFSRLDKSLWGLLASLMADSWWAERYPAALERAGQIPFLRDGAGRQRGALDVSEFLRDPDLCRKILDGVYDPRPAGGATGTRAPPGSFTQKAATAFEQFLGNAPEEAPP